MTARIIYLENAEHNLPRGVRVWMRLDDMADFKPQKTRFSLFTNAEHKLLITASRLPETSIEELSRGGCLTLERIGFHITHRATELLPDGPRFLLEFAQIQKAPVSQGKDGATVRYREVRL